MELKKYEVVFINDECNSWYITEDILTEIENAINTYTSYKDTRLRLREVINEVNNYGTKNKEV